MLEIVTEDLEDMFPNHAYFEGAIAEQMPILISEGYEPVSIVEVLENRLREVDNEVKSLFTTAFICTGDSIFRNSDGRIKIVYDSDRLKTINDSNSQNIFYLKDNVFDSIDGIEFSENVANRYMNRQFSPDEVPTNPIWLALVRDNFDLLKNYSEYVSSVAPRGSKIMGIYHDDLINFLSRYRCSEAMLGISNANFGSSISVISDYKDPNFSLVGVKRE